MAAGVEPALEGDDLGDSDPAPGSPRAALLDLLCARGILHGTTDQPIRSTTGQTAPWMLDSLGVTLTAEGASLAARCLLELLDRFEGRQLATYGVIGIPLLQACILESGGRYRGLIVRKERKGYGSGRIVEGPIERAEPVVLIDDSIVSGYSMWKGAEHLEAAGLFVEGAVALVRFGYDRGMAKLRERGLRVAALFDVWRHVVDRVEGRPAPARPHPGQNPSRRRHPFAAAGEPAPEGLHPARLARLTMVEALARGRALTPPARLGGDRPWDASGGAWVSVRSREDPRLRHARDGFWRLPGEAEPPGAGPATAAASVVEAALATAAKLRALPDALDRLAASAVAVTFFSALERCEVGDLDNDRYGIVAQSRERPLAIGGALPRMPGIGSAWAQFRHARVTNAKLFSFEPYDLFRHDLVKVVEPEAAWPRAGAPLEPAAAAWAADPAVAGRVAARARDLALARLIGRPEETAPLPDDLLPRDLDSLYVSILERGRLVGCQGAVIRSLDRDLGRLVDAALADTRFAPATATAPAPATASAPGVGNGGGSAAAAAHAHASAAAIATEVSFLWGPARYGPGTPEQAWPFYRHGYEALMAFRDGKVGLLLPHVAAMHDLSPVAFARAVAEKGGLGEGASSWCRFECATWLAADGRLDLLEGGLPADSAIADAGRTALPEPAGGAGEADGPARARAAPSRPRSAAPEMAPAALLERHLDLCSGYLLRQQRADGSLWGGYHPFRDREVEGLALPRLAHAGWMFARLAAARGEAPWLAAARATADRLLRFLGPTEAEGPAPGASATGPGATPGAAAPMPTPASAPLSPPLPTPGRWLVAAGEETTTAEVSFLLLLLLALPADDPRRAAAPGLVRTLVDAVSASGRVATHRDPTQANDAHQDYYPGQTLLALAAAAQAGADAAVGPAIGPALDPARLERALRVYRHRFRYKRRWGQVAWLLQGFTAWWRMTGDRRFADFAFEVADWALGFQCARTGGFLNDHQPDAPGFTTALYLEGVAPALLAARDLGDEARRARYARACTEGLRFLDRLVYQDRDAVVLPHPERARGGVRQSLVSAFVRTDFVQHLLSFELALAGALAAGGD